MNARQLGIPTASGRTPGQGDELVTRVVSVSNVGAAQLVPLLRPLIPQQSHLAAHPGSNTLILTDRATNIARMLEIIERIDRKGSEDIEVIRLEHAAAGEVVRILGVLKQQEKGKGSAPKTNTTLIADERTNSVLLAGEQRERLRVRAVIAHLDTPLESTGNTKVVYLRYAKAADLVPVLTGVSDNLAKDQSKQKAPAASASAITITAEESTNALVITAPPDLLRSLEGVIRQLDIRRAQVHVEAIIAEVSINAARQFGINWLRNGAASDSPVAATNFFGETTNTLGLVTGTGGSLGSGLTLGLGAARDTGNNYAAILRALADDSATNILSTPSLTTMDNEEAEIVVAENVPFITGNYTNPGSGDSGASNPFQTISREDVGLTLKLTPQVNEGDTIKLDIEQEVSQVVSGEAGLQTTTKRAIKTSVMVEDGRMVALGGLIDEKIDESEQRVPLLGDIPVLGWLFRSKTTSRVKRNLMVFLHPNILRDMKDDTRLASRKYSAIRQRQLQVQEKGIGLMSDDVAPILPPFEELVPIPDPFHSAPEATSSAEDSGDS